MESFEPSSELAERLLKLELFDVRNSSAFLTVERLLEQVDASVDEIATCLAGLEQQGLVAPVQRRGSEQELIESVVADLNANSGLTLPLKIVQATQAGDGAVRIDAALLERIAHAEFFLGDVTPVTAYDDRLRPNDNVLIETGYALASKDPGQVILLARTRDDLQVPGGRFAFDIGNVRRHPFKSKSDLRRRLSTELDAALRKRGWLR